jgi:hypothetical protein
MVLTEETTSTQKYGRGSEKCITRLRQKLRQIGNTEQLVVWDETWPGPAMELVGPLAAHSPRLRLAPALEMEIERHCSADEILQGRLIDLVAFVDVDGAPGIPVQAGVE